MNLRGLAAGIAATVFALALTASDVEQIRAKGVGKTYLTAVNEALVVALEQHEGVTLSTTERAQIAKSAVSTSAGQNGQIDDQRKLEINDSINRDMKIWAKGRIRGFSVVSDVYEADRDRYTVEVLARFSGSYKDPNPEAVDKRRRMAVAVFRPVRSSYAWRGQAGGTTEWAMALADKLNVCLTQTRKFAMLDRKFDAELEDELAHLSDANAAAEDVGRLGRKLGTDYLVVGEITFNDVAAPAVNPYTGRLTAPPNQLFAEITYRVLLAPTGQLKWSDVVRIDAAAFAVNDLATFVSATTEAAATSISDGMMSNILPFEIVGKTASGQLVVGEGGKSLRAGECFTVFALGEEVKDTRTGEVLDTLEDAVGTVQIVRVTEKLSYAQVVEGDAAKMVTGARLRRVPLSAAPKSAPAAAPATSIQVTPSGGVVAPF